MAEQTLPEDAEHPIWKPSGAGSRTKVRNVEHLALLMSGLSRRGDGFAIVEWPRPFPQPWAQTAAAGRGLIVELNDGVLSSGCGAPCTRRAFRGMAGDYPLPNESDPGYKTSKYPVLEIETFTPLAGAELIWTWINSRVLLPGIVVTMRHFGERERRSLGCGDL